MSDMIIRKAQGHDLPALLAIYNDEILHGVATFDTAPLTEEAGQAWLTAHDDSHPMWVAEIDGAVAGYVSFSPFKAKAAWGRTAELSLYVAASHRGKGIATRLMAHALSMAPGCGIHAVVSLITAGNAASVRLHQKAAFTHCGTLREVGCKFGRVLDVEVYQIIV